MKGNPYLPPPDLDDLKKLWKFVRPGGPLIGLNPKKSFITPIDFVPWVGPVNKLNKGRKLLSSSKAWKHIGQGLAQIPGDILLLLGLTALYKELTSSGGSGSPAGASPTRTKNAPSASKKSRCPPGHRWDPRRRTCVKLRR